MYKKIALATSNSILIVLASILYSHAQLPITLPDILSNHAVLQKQSNITLWGKGPAGYELKIVASWNQNDTIRLTIPNTCMWQTHIETPAEEGPYDIHFISGKEIKTISDIILGDVWLCSGQSNMEFNMHWGLDTSSSKYKIQPNNKIRFFQVERNFDNVPVSNAKGKWTVCDRNTAMDFSTVGYFFGKKIQEQTGIPIGLVGSYWGGTNIQAWMPAASFEGSDLSPSLMHTDPYEGAPRGFSILYNGMIYPLLHYSIKGCIWYQGETNVDYDWNRYGSLLSSMIAAWRFGMNNSFPFYTIQIAPWNGYQKRHAAYLREQESQLSKTVPGYGTISIMDLVDDTTNIHPKIKREVGDRIGNLVLHNVYHSATGNPVAPKIIQSQITNDYVIVTYKSSSPLTFRGSKINAFEIAGADQVFYEANATLEENYRIKIFSAKVPKPLYIRYCFKNASLPNLFNQSGLPLDPFRSDDLDEQ